MSSSNLKNLEYCQYVGGECSRVNESVKKNKRLFLYPNEPRLISAVIENTAENYKKKYGKDSCLTWRDIRNEGKTVFCEICKKISESELIICDITTLNFNLLFEIGFVVGSSKAFIPIFEKSFEAEKHLLERVGLLDTTGYKEFLNTDELLTIVEAGADSIPLSRKSVVDTFQPVFYMKAPFDTDSSLRISSRLKKSAFRFRLFDPTERTRLPLHVAVQQVDKSRSVILSLQSPKRGNVAVIHNARCAFVAGLALAAQKRILILQEGKQDHPIDYRDMVREYETLKEVDVIIDDFLRDLVLALQSPSKHVEATQRSTLEDVDVGDIAAESEIENLKSYFVRTGQYTEARNGHAQIVVGRKGSGKTALFYALRHHVGPQRNDALVLDLKPEGYQFAKLQEAVLKHLTEGLQAHTMTAFWDYLLLLELAHKILNDRKEITIAAKDSDKREKHRKLELEYEKHRNLEEADFSERLTSLVNKIIERIPGVHLDSGAPEITNLIFKHDIKILRDLIVDYLGDKEEVWLLFDNLDKNWTVRSDSKYEAMILRCLLDATRKLKKMLGREGVNFQSVVFVRNDIYKFFLDNTSDRGKDQVAHLDWNDPDVFKELFRQRIVCNPDYKGTADEIWGKVFNLHVMGMSSFNYVIERTLMRPRDFLCFIHNALQTAINRGHNRILGEDIQQAEEAYSRDLFEGLSYEIRDIDSSLENILYAFLESERILYYSQLETILVEEGKIDKKDVERVIELLLWFGFLGVVNSEMLEKYAYSVGYDIKMLLRHGDWTTKQNAEKLFSIHLGFQKALELR